METTLTIQQLYDRVWAEPIHRIAKEFGLSDRGLGKFCERLDIPVPPRGYWRAKETGHNPKRPALPRSVDPSQTIYVGRNPPPPPPQISPEGEVNPLIAFERDPANRIVVPEKVRLTHPLIRSTQEAWRPGVPWNERPPALDIRVTRPQRRRALAIMQTLIVALEQRGFKVAIRERKTIVQLLGEEDEIRISEKSKQVPHTPTADELRWQARVGSAPPKHDLAATGTLVLHIEDAYWSRRSWSDGKNRRIEDCLNEFIEGLITAALIHRKHREEREADERKRQEETRRRQEEQERIRQFTEWMEAWNKAEDIRSFVAAARGAFGPQISAKHVEWLEWGVRWADSIDPLGQRG